MANGQRMPEPEYTCGTCIFNDVCLKGEDVCSGYYGEDIEERLQEVEDAKRKTEYLNEWGTYLYGSH